ncbi:MAG: hypothetical protein WCD16_06405 [Paracoccaceae bacterium]
MKIRTFLAMSATAALMSTAALAQSSSNDPVIDQIVADLSGQGYTHIEIKRGTDRIRVEARGPDGSVEAVYDASGAPLSQETSASGSDNGTNVSGDTSSDDSSADDNSDDDGPNHDMNDDHDGAGGGGHDGGGSGGGDDGGSDGGDDGGSDD